MIVAQRYHRIKLPPYLAFFGGRRFVPIITSFVAIAAAVLMGLVYPAFNTGLTNLGEWVTNNDVTGGFVYGTLKGMRRGKFLGHAKTIEPYVMFDGSFPCVRIVISKVSRLVWRGVQPVVRFSFSFDMTHG